jgi:predicted transcriptional regulator
MRSGRLAERRWLQAFAMHYYNRATKWCQERGMADHTGPELLTLTARIVSSYVAHHACAPDELPALIGIVRQALAGLASPEQDAEQSRPSSADRPEPAVPIKRSVFRDHIVCLEDGRKLKTLKRHLSIAYGLTPDAYRVRWGLPSSYPMVAPDYAEARSALARRIGLGHRAATSGSLPDTSG